MSEQELNQDDAETEQKIINEEYKTWKKNAPFLYDIILSTALDWPTLTTQWFPDITEYELRPCVVDSRLMRPEHLNRPIQNTGC